MTLGIALAVFCPLLAVLALWSRSVVFVDKHTRLATRISMRALNFSPAFRFQEIRSIVLWLVYLGAGLIVSLGMVGAASLDLTRLLAVDAGTLPLALLLFAGQISVSALINSCIVHPVVTRALHSDTGREVDAVYWIQGLAQLPPRMVMIAPGISGCVEEFAFRGALLFLCLDRLHMGVAGSIAVSASFFFIQQILQLQTLAQVLVIGASCLVISIIGGMGAVWCGSVIPACLAHAFFAIFYVRYSREAAARAPRARNSARQPVSV